jgi:hypothetical protein
MDDRGSRIRFPAGAANFWLHHRVQNSSGAHPVSFPIGTGDSFPGAKRTGREADHSPPTSAEVKNILLSLWNTKVHHRVHKKSPLDPLLSQLNPVLPTDTNLPKVQLMLFSHPRLGLPSGPLTSGLPTKTL